MCSPKIDPESLKRRRDLLAIIFKYKFSSILDIGCGKGEDMELLKILFPNIQIVGIDKNYQAENILQADALKVVHGIADNSYDLVITDAVMGDFFGQTSYANWEGRPTLEEQFITELIRISKQAVIMLEKYIPINLLSYQKTEIDFWATQKGYIYEFIK